MFPREGSFLALCSRPLLLLFLRQAGTVETHWPDFHGSGFSDNRCNNRYNSGNNNDNTDKRIPMMKIIKIMT